jgi:hypothetical protein
MEQIGSAACPFATASSSSTHSTALVPEKRPSRSMVLIRYVVMCSPIFRDHTLKRVSAIGSKNPSRSASELTMFTAMPPASLRVVVSSVLADYPKLRWPPNQYSLVRYLALFARVSLCRNDHSAAAGGFSEMG